MAMALALALAMAMALAIKSIKTYTLKLKIMGIFTSKYKRMYENELKTKEALMNKNDKLIVELKETDNELSIVNNNISRQTDMVNKFKYDNILLNDEKTGLLDSISKLKNSISEKDSKISLLNQDNDALSKRVEILKKENKDKTDIIKSVENERKSFIDTINKLQEEVKDITLEKNDLVNYITDNDTLSKEGTIPCHCDCENCDEIHYVGECIEDQEIDAKIEVITEEPKPEVKLSKSQLKKLKKQGK